MLGYKNILLRHVYVRIRCCKKQRWQRGVDVQPQVCRAVRGSWCNAPDENKPDNRERDIRIAKSDEGFKALAEHENDKSTIFVVAARLGTKSTLEETRTERFISIAKRGLLPVPVRYYAAHTGDGGGDDKINLQNLPSRGVNGKKLKKAIKAPVGHTLIDADSSQIEARVLAWLSEQEDLVNQFANGEDVYVKIASSIYAVPEDQVTKDQRFVERLRSWAQGMA